jgi:hypothetical protein
MSTAYDGPGIRAPGGPEWRLAHALALLFVALCCALVLLAPPESGILKRNLPTPDMPWEGFGIAEVYITPAGNWLISRREYVDRVPRYQINPNSTYVPLRESITPYRDADVSGSFSSNRQVTPAGSTLRITSRRGTGYRLWMQLMRDDPRLADYLNPLPGGQPAEAAAEVPFVGPLRLKQRELLDAMPSGITVIFNQHEQIVPVTVLPGHWLYEVYDSACYVDPYVYVTTDRQRVLHKLRLTDHGDTTAVSVERSVELAAHGAAPASSRCRLVHDPRRGICILRTDGSVEVYDPQTLEHSASEQLPGVWEIEYAAYDLRPGTYNPQLGTPLTRRQYERAMQGLMLGFLASLLGLALLWRPQWKSTSAATTADSSSSGGSAST